MWSKTQKANAKKIKLALSAVVLIIASLTVVELTDCDGLMMSGQCFTIEKMQNYQQGLSGRPTFDANKVALFNYKNPNNQCFWMKDMRFPIDIVWLDANKKVIKVEQNVQPSTYPEAFCADNTKYVLETVANRSGVKVGDKVKFMVQ